MASYYFNLDGAPSAAVKFKNLADAKREALCYLAQVAGETSHEFWREPMLAMTVTDEEGRILFTLRLVGTVASRCA